MKKQSSSFSYYEGHRIHIWRADGAWHFEVAIMLPAGGQGGFETTRQAVAGAIDFVDSLVDKAPKHSPLRCVFH
jgi:hypothetical protein